MNKLIRIAFAISLLCCYTSSFAQSTIWTKNTSSKQNSQSTKTLFYDLDKDVLNKLTENKQSFSIYFPDKNGNQIAYKVVKTSTLSPSLQKKYASVNTFKGYAINNRSNKIRFAYSKELGLKGTIISNANEVISIAPSSKSSHKFSLETNSSGFDCLTKDILIDEDHDEDHSHKSGQTDLDVNDGKLRRYKIAVSTTAEYSNFYLDGSETSDEERKTKVLTAVSGAIERINELFDD